MRFVVDAQLPPALARWLADRGHEAEHVQDCGLLTAGDGSIWSYALQVGAVIVTKDEDFSVRSLLSPTRPGVAWIRLGNARTAHLLRWFELKLPELERAFDRGEDLVELV